MKAFEEKDAKAMPEPGGVVFVGSSTIRLWKLDESFPGKKYVNRGFGGSQLSDSVQYADRIVTKYKPATIVLYAGDNDIAGGRTPERVRDDYKAFVAAVRSKLPESRIIFLGIKPSPRRWEFREKFQKCNQLVREVQKGDSRQIYVDTWDCMLGPDGQPRKELYLVDTLHMSVKGYEIWNKLLAPHLEK
ncbi:MAG: hypothetical protein K1X57_04865 [Gemmataceae bacterium]|nr:hypothetical protein [Gemmataceae bacterium]